MSRIFLVLICCTFNTFAVDIMSPERATNKNHQSDVIAKKELVVTNNKWASMAAMEILKQGGSAVDAAISAGFVLGLTEPQSSGIGGGGYSLVYDKGRILAYDGREFAPSNANKDWFRKADGSYMSFREAYVTPYAVGIPSEVALFKKLHDSYGKLAWSKLLAPAIKLAHNGFPMSSRLHGLLMSESQTICLDRSIQKVYCDKHGKVKPVGSYVVNKDYAHTLSVIAKNPSEFYTGNIFSDIIKKVNGTANKQLMTKKDFTDYSVIVVEPLCSKYRDKYTVCSVPPSSSGGVTLLEMLGIYANLGYIHDANNFRWQYNFLQASKLAFADRNKYIADPNFVTNPVAGLLDNNYIKQRSSLVSPNMGLKMPVKYGTPKMTGKIQGTDNEPKAHGTTSLIVVDKNRQVVTMTVTIENQFGSHLFVDGFFLNNELTDFALNPYDNENMLVANRVDSKKRPRSSIAPVIVFDENKNLNYALGSPGGSQIICYVAKSLIQMIDFGYSPAQAAASGNLCAPNNVVMIESDTTSSQLVAKLQPLEPQQITVSEMVSGEVNVKFESTLIIGSADPRREGLTLGR